MTGSEIVKKKADELTATQSAELVALAERVRGRRPPLAARRPRVARHRSARWSRLVFLASRFCLSVSAAFFFEDLLPPLSLPAIRWPPEWVNREG